MTLSLNSLNLPNCECGLLNAGCVSAILVALTKSGKSTIATPKPIRRKKSPIPAPKTPHQPRSLAPVSSLKQRNFSTVGIRIFDLFGLTMKTEWCFTNGMSFNKAYQSSIRNYYSISFQHFIATRSWTSVKGKAIVACSKLAFPCFCSPSHFLRSRKTFALEEQPPFAERRESKSRFAFQKNIQVNHGLKLINTKNPELFSRKPRNEKLIFSITIKLNWSVRCSFW